MKKLAIASAIIALSSSALAADNSFYVKAGGTSSWGTKINSTDKTKLGVTSTDYGTMSIGGYAGVGYNLMDNIRGELSASYVSGPTYKDLGAKTADATLFNAVSDQTISDGKVSLENSGFVGFVSGFVDVADMGLAKVYVGIGGGASYMETKITTVVSSDTKTATYSKELAFAYHLGGGLAFEASPGMLFDVGYSYTNLGKPGKLEKAVGNLSAESTWDLKALDSHNLNVGVRFSM
jgi:opacity protein-like surface antigen